MQRSSLSKAPLAVTAAMAAALTAGCGSDAESSAADAGPSAVDAGGPSATEDAGSSADGGMDAAVDAGVAACELTGSYNLSGDGPQRRVVFRNAVYIFDRGDGTGAFRGIYEETPDDGLTLQDPVVCQLEQRGLYRTDWATDCTSFLMTLLEDPCAGRAAALEGVTFTRI